MVGVSAEHSEDIPKLVKPTWKNCPNFWVIRGPPESPLQVLPFPPVGLPWVQIMAESIGIPDIWSVS